tara:strand:+ start:160 stop:4734 length:4575 start_codon:yes stop_codon:yes gene_type:complete
MALTKVAGDILDPGLSIAGVVTATAFDGPFRGGSGSDVTAGVGTFTQLDVNGSADFNGNVTIGGSFTVQGDYTTLNTTLRNVELLRVSTASTLPAGIITQTGTGDILNLYDNTTEVFSVADGGNVDVKAGNVTLEEGRLFVKRTTIPSVDVRNSTNTSYSRVILQQGAAEGGYFQISREGTNSTAGAGANSVELNQSSNHPLTIKTNNTERLRIKGTGEVGINTTTPQTELEVFSDTSSDITIHSARTSGTLGGINFANGASAAGIVTAQYFVGTAGHHYWHCNGTERLKLENDGDLTITGVDNAELKLKCGTSTGNNILAFLNSAGATKGRIFYDSDNNFMVFNTDGTSDEKMRITNAGKVGIGTADPQSLIHTQASGSNGLMMQTPLGDHYIWGIQAAGNLMNGSTAGDLGIRGKSGISISGNNGTSTQVRIDSSGRVLIGSTSARVESNGFAAPLQVEGTSTATSSVIIARNSANASSSNLIFQKSRGTSVGSATSINSGDAVGTIIFEGADGTNTDPLASIIGACDGTTGTNDVPGRLVFSTTADGAASPTERLRIDKDGHVTPGALGTQNFGSASKGWGNVYIADDKQLTLGNDSNLYIKHSNGHANNFIVSSVGDIEHHMALSKKIIKGFNNSGAPYVNLYYNNAIKLTTTGGGITVAGIATATAYDFSAISITSGKESPYDESGSGETIFIYDTRNDADGGAWRKKCRHTSWYNETAGTYRGTRKEFPAVAVIVLGQVRTTIYDGDDPTMPLWMQFRSSSEGYMLGCNDDRPSCVTALNGVIYIGAKNVYGGFHIIDFIKDTAKRVRASVTSNGTHGWWPTGIAGRNGTDDSGGLWTESGRGYDNTDLGTLKSDDVWSVAVKALRGAPIDPITNLPIPTIAVAVDAGISIIKPEWTMGLNRSNTPSNHVNDVSGHIVDINSNDNGYTQGYSVEWTDNDDLIFVMGDGNGDYCYIHTMDGHIKWDNAITIDTKTGGSGHNVRSMWRGLNSNSAIYSNLLSIGSDWSTTWNTHQHKVPQVTAKKGYEFAARTRGGLNHIYENPEGDNSMIAYTTKSYTTGWLVGKEKMCVMASTDDTNLSGTDLAPNNCASAGPGRTEANTTTGWTNAGFVQWGSSNTRAYNGSYSIHATANSNGDAAYFSFTTVVGKKYSVSARLWVTHDSFTIKLGTSGIDGNQYFESPPIGTVAQWQMFTGTFQATTTTAYFNLTESSTSQDSDGYIDSVIVTEADPDHTNTHGFSGAGSRNQGLNRGLQVYGTVTKQAVATGAELCSYSGWSSDNYLYQAYNPNLNHGSGDFAFYWWMNPNDSQGGKTIWSISDDETLSSGNDMSYLRVYFNGDDIRFDMSTAGFAYDPNQKGLLMHPQDMKSWMLCHIIRRGNTMELWVNGRRELVRIMNTGMWDNSPFTAYSELRIGHDTSTGAADSEIEMALFRSSRSAPNEHQIQKMYKDELPLFQENAKCTLIGTTNDHIEAMAYDKRNDILYVGAKGGRADFSGLVRINNNTTEVTRGVSASNDLVVEY